MRLTSPYPLTWDPDTRVIHLCDPDPIPEGTLVQPGDREGWAEFQSSIERDAFIAEQKLAHSAPIP